MARYVDQAFFDHAAVTAALAAETDGAEDLLEHLLSTMERDYQDEFLRDEVLSAGQRIQQMVREHVAEFSASDEFVVPLLLALCKMVHKEKPDGTKRSRWFRGQIFHRQRTELPDKVETAQQHLAQYLAMHMMRAVGPIFR